MQTEPVGAAFYARTGGRPADWWTLLHPPYTVWHLSYVVLGAGLTATHDWAALGASVLAFFLGVGVAAHALDELHGRPLGTAIGRNALALAAAAALVAACALGGYGAFRDGVDWPLLVAVPVGVVLVLGYNLEPFGGVLHRDSVFALAWGGFPVVVGYLAQAPAWSWHSLAGLVAGTAAGVTSSAAQRALSTPARGLRRRTASVEGLIVRDDGRRQELDRSVLLAPLEGALRLLAWAVPLFAVALLLVSWS